MQAEKSWLDHLRRRFERFLSGRAPSDPLYLTNRTWKQKLRLAAVIGVPVLVLGALVIVTSTNGLHFGTVNPYEHTLAEAALPAPKQTSDPKLAPADLEVINIRIAKDINPPVVTGTVRNNTSRKINSAEVTYYLADNSGSVIGTQTTSVPNVGPHDSVSFQAPLKMAEAGYVLMRDVRAN
ncbi:MAG: FxLYD domain-containing protein [Bryobacteraceae bacterium]|jgi:hypothetical protein